LGELSIDFRDNGGLEVLLEKIRTILLAQNLGLAECSQLFTRQPIVVPVSRNYRHFGSNCPMFKDMTQHLSGFAGGRSAQTLDKMMNDRKHFVFCPHKYRLITVS
jgi:hypothetical protein